MHSKYGYAIHELHFAEDGEKVTVTADSVVPLTKDVFDEFVALNAARAATDDEVAAAKALDYPGVTKTPVAPSAAESEAKAEATATEVAQAEQKREDAKQSVAVAAESDRNREAAKGGAAKPGADASKDAAKATKPAAPAADAAKADAPKGDTKPAGDDGKNDPLA